MKLPPKPPIDYDLDLKAWEDWGRACAEAALIEAFAACQGVVERDDVLEWPGVLAALHEGEGEACIAAIRNIKIDG